MSIKLCSLERDESDTKDARNRRGAVNKGWKWLNCSEIFLNVSSVVGFISEVFILQSTFKILAGEG